MFRESDRFYRYQHLSRQGWVSFQARYRETDLWIRARCLLEKEALEVVLNCRHQLEAYIGQHPDFLHSLVPLPDDPFAPPLVRQMLRAAREAGVGPMASVAGAIAQSVGLSLKSLSSSIIVENGGDCYLDLQEDTSVGIYAGPDSPFTGKIALRFAADRFPLGICTSSGTIGHSLSFGKADAVTVVARDAALADAGATALGNLVQDPQDIRKVLEHAPTIPHIEGALVIVRDKMGLWGSLELVPL
jgi:ApbE superfamily uncharacterized protein (UPF0280 family)